MGLWSLFINVLIKSMCIAIHSVLLTSIDFNEQIKIIFYILIAILTPFFICLICNSYLIKNIADKLKLHTEKELKKYDLTLSQSRGVCRFGMLLSL